MGFDLEEYGCAQHGGLEHAYAHVAGIAISSHATAMTYESVAVPTFKDFARSVEAGNLGGVEFGDDSRWGHATTEVQAKLALEFTLAGCVAELVLFGHSIPHVQRQDLMAWYRSLGHTDELVIENIVERTGISLNETLSRVHGFIIERQPMVQAVAGALRDAPHHRLSAGEVAMVAAGKL